MEELGTYNRKRDFRRTPEPAGKIGRTAGDSFVIQRHDASHLHYDFRLEVDGVLKSWAIPKGPSLDPKVKRLAVEVEDHPLSYGKFFGTIPKGEYGAGTVKIWDKGTWICHGDVHKQLQAGRLHFSLRGQKLSGSWNLLRLRPTAHGKPNWLLIKVKDEAAHMSADAEPKKKESQPARAARQTPSPEESRLTHPDKVLYPPDGPTKRELADYYAKVARRMWKYVEGRPLVLLRCPDGTGKECFFQKHVEINRIEPGFAAVRVKEKSGTGEYRYLISPAGLRSAAQLGTLELHVWGARADDLEHPNELVIDLDPGPGVSFAQVAQAARHVRELLSRLGLRSFPMLTGGKGVHVHVPIAPRYLWDEIKNFSEAVARQLQEDRPALFTTTPIKAKRSGKIFIDYLRNQRGALFIAPFSPRTRNNAAVAVPISWQALSTRTRPDAYSVRTIEKYLRAYKRDPWTGYSQLSQRIALLDS